MSNQTQFVESFYACAKSGFVFVALNWRLTVPELSFQLMDCGATAVIYGADQQALVDPLREQFPAVRWLLADDGPHAAASIAAATTAEPPIGATGEDPLFMMYTSGTTGRPKGALMSHRGNIAWLASMLATSDLHHGERQIIVAPLFHIAGLGLLVTAVYRGMTSVLLKQFDPGAMWDLVDAENITGFFGVPAMLAFMYQHPKRATAARPKLRWVLCGAAPVPVTLIEAYLQMGIEVLQVYGLTETHGGICLMSPEHARTKVGSTGMPYFGIDVRVVDKAGNPVPPGIAGRSGHARPAPHHGILESSRSDAGDDPRGLVPHGRHRGGRRRRLHLHQGPLEGHGDLGRRERVPGRGRGRAERPRGRARGGRDRPALRPSGARASAPWSCAATAGRATTSCWCRNCARWRTSRLARFKQPKPTSSCPPCPAIRRARS